MITGTLSSVDGDGDDGTLLGISGHRVMDGIVENYDFAVFLSYSRLSADDSVSLFDLGAVISSREAFGANKNLYWYANVFLARATGNGSENDFGLGGGIVMPSTSGEFYVGADLIDDLVFGIGYRHFLK